MSEQVKEEPGDQSNVSAGESTSRTGEASLDSQNLVVMEQSLHIILRATKNLGTEMCHQPTSQRVDSHRLGRLI